MTSDATRDIQATYDLVADDYVRHIYDELKDKPLDRELLDRFVSVVEGLICDMGTGPGHVARYLHERGAKVCGIDLAPEMVARARRLNPGIEFEVGDMFALEAADNTYSGITAFYSLVHIPREEVVRALRELHRVLRPGGVLFIAFHVGEGVLHRDEWWGAKVSLDVYFFGVEEMCGYLRAAGFNVAEITERDPYPEAIEHQSRRAYIFARKAEAAAA